MRRGFIDGAQLTETTKPPGANPAASSTLCPLTCERKKTMEDAKDLKETQGGTPPQLIAGRAVQKALDECSDLTEHRAAELFTIAHGGGLIGDTRSRTIPPLRPCPSPCLRYWYVLLWTLLSSASPSVPQKVAVPVPCVISRIRESLP